MRALSGMLGVSLLLFVALNFFLLLDDAPLVHADNTFLEVFSSASNATARSQASRPDPARASHLSCDSLRPTLLLARLTRDYVVDMQDAGAFNISGTHRGGLP